MAATQRSFRFSSVQQAFAMRQAEVSMAFYLTSPSHYRILFTTVATLTDNKTKFTIETCRHWG